MCKCYKTRKVMKQTSAETESNVCYLNLCQGIQSGADDGVMLYYRLWTSLTGCLYLHDWLWMLYFPFDDIFNFQLSRILLLIFNCCIYDHVETSIGGPENVFETKFSRDCHKEYFKYCFSLSIQRSFGCWIF